MGKILFQMANIFMDMYVIRRNYLGGESTIIEGTSV